MYMFNHIQFSYIHKGIGWLLGSEYLFCCLISLDAIWKGKDNIFHDDFSPKLLMLTRILCYSLDWHILFLVKVR